MRILIFTHQRPELSQTWLQNELDILENEKIKCLVIYDSKVYLKRQPMYQNYIKKFVYIPRCPKDTFKILKYLLYHLRSFITHPLSYSEVLFFILTHYHWVYLRDFFKLVKVLPQIEMFNPDMIYSHYIYDQYIFAFLSSLFFHNKCGLIFHSTYPHPRHISTLLTQASFILAKSNHVREDFLRKYPEVSANKVKVLPWGIDTRFFKPFEEGKRADRIFTLVSISRFVEMKGLDYLIKACRILVDRKIIFKCIIIGYGLEQWKLQRYIAKNNLLDYIEIRQAIPHSVKFKNILSSSHLFVLPAIVDIHGEFDFIPNAVLEAMTMEKVVMTTRVTGMQEVAKDGESIFFVKEKDPEDLAEKIKIVMKLSKEKRREIGRKAREIVVKYYDKGKQGRKFIEFLKNQINNY